MGVIAESVGAGLGAEHVFGVIPAALAPREVGVAATAPVPRMQLPPEPLRFLVGFTELSFILTV